MLRTLSSLENSSFSSAVLGGLKIGVATGWLKTTYKENRGSSFTPIFIARLQLHTYGFFGLRQSEQNSTYLPMTSDPKNLYAEEKNREKPLNYSSDSTNDSKDAR